MLAMRQQHADLETAREFYASMAKTLQPEFVAAVASSLETKGTLLRRQIEGGIDSSSLSDLLTLFFGFRRKRGKLLAAVDGEWLSSTLARLQSDPAGALEALANDDPDDQLRLFDLGTEVLHALEPEHFPLWTRWIFDPEAETGALLLLLDDETDLFGHSRLDTYGRLREVNEYLIHTLYAAGMPVDPLRPFTLDVFLAGVYGVYVNTVLQMRMSKEFNKLLPELGEFTQRLLGTKTLGVNGAGSR